MAILELKDVSYRYGAGKKEVVKHVNVSFEQGHFTSSSDGPAAERARCYP